MKTKLITAMIFLLVTNSLWACTLSVSPLNFGSYNPISNQPASSQANINLQCANGVAYTIILDTGLNSSTNLQRKLKRNLGLDTVNYNLYRAATYNSIWGDGSNGTSPVYSTGNGTVKTHPVFGLIPASQNVRVGSYSDTITIRVDF